MEREIEVDNHKLMYHPKRVAEWLEKGDCYPIYVEIGPTNRCNHGCVFCALDWVGHTRIDIDREVLCRNLEDIASHGVKSIMFAGEGEPLLHKDISYFVKKAKEYGLDVSITTNGVLFDGKIAERCLPYLSWIRFSIDAGNRDSYAAIHKTRKKDFDRVIKNIKNAVEIKKSKGYGVIIGNQILILPQTINELSELAEILREAGADNLQLKPYSQHPLSQNRFVIPKNLMRGLDKKASELSDDNFKVIYREKTVERLHNRSYNECLGLPFSALIDAKGNVIPCNLFYNNPEFYYGNINEKSFSEIWKSEQRKKVIEKIAKKGIDNCRAGCRLDPSNRYLFQLKNPHPHANFI